MNIMNSPFQYNAVYAKCRAMSASFLKESDYVYLSKLTDLKDVANFLSENDSYSKEFKNIDLSKVNRNFLEQILNKNIYDTYTKLYIFTTGGLQKFIGAMKDKFEVDFILKCILKHYRPSDNLAENHFLTYDVRYENLYKSANSQELINQLENTVYGKALKNIVWDDTIDIAHVETLLYNAYYDKLYYSYRQDDKKIIAMKILIENVQRLLRLKYKFNLETSQIYPYLINLKKIDKVNKLLEVSNLSDDKFFAVIAKRLKMSNVPENVNELITANYFDNLIYKKAKKIFLDTKPSFENPFAFLSLKEYEVKNLIHIIEGVRYHISSDTILKYIIGLEG
jgi:Archaeal/vacuolar-type H+-ATPase subunit C